MMSKEEAPSAETFWQARGNWSFAYRGETFYTVTAAPLYYRRREILRNLLVGALSSPTYSSVLDFGCGDGYWMSEIKRLFPDKQVCGEDTSDSMLQRARSRVPSQFLRASNGSGSWERRFSAVLSVAVFAHVLSDNELARTLRYIYEATDEGGILIAFEQTAPARRSGEWWCRRTSSEYVLAARQAGFECVEMSLITFTAHRFFERRIAPYLRALCAGNSESERAVMANRWPLYRGLSRLFVMISWRTVRRNTDECEGNTFFVFRKVSSTQRDSVD